MDGLAEVDQKLEDDETYLGGEVEKTETYPGLESAKARDAGGQATCFFLRHDSAFVSECQANLLTMVRSRDWCVPGRGRC